MSFCTCYFLTDPLGYDVHCLDQRLPSFRLPKDILVHQEDLMSLNIDPDTFDAVSCISVIEHVGMGRYNDPICSVDGDIKAIRELLRILKPYGRLIVTTNVCKETHIHDGEIRYGKSRFKKLISLGEEIQTEYRCFDGRRWESCSEENAFSYNGNDFGLAMFVMRKE